MMPMTILVESFAGYRRITLNRPERLNALTVEMAAALAAALDDAVADKTCRAILLTGAGRGFCAGQDLTEIIGSSPADLDRLLAHYHPLILKIRALPIPVVCAVNGVAAGAGAKRALDVAGDNTLAQQLDLEGELQRQAGAHPDHAEGVRAFLEKRAPTFARARS